MEKAAKDALALNEAGLCGAAASGFGSNCQIVCLQTCGSSREALGDLCLLHHPSFFFCKTLSLLDGVQLAIC